MPDRVKCLHVLVGHALAAGPGVNPLGDEALALLPDWWAGGSCVARGRARGRAVIRRVAAIDCGTNSIRLLVADLDPATGAARRPRPADGDRPARARASTAPGGSSEAALARTFAACEGYAARIAELGATDGALRRDVGVARRREPRRLRRGRRWSGSASSRRSCRATRRPRCRSAAPTGALQAAGIAGPYLVVDIGGGSTEFVLGDSSVRASRSVDIGCVRLTERHLHDDPPTAAQVAAARADIDGAARRGGGRRAAGHAARRWSGSPAR